MAAMVDSQPLRNGVMENDVNVQFLDDHHYMHQVREHAVLHISWCLLAFFVSRDGTKNALSWARPACTFKRVKVTSVD
jgi:hypothetical protein